MSLLPPTSRWRPKLRKGLGVDGSGVIWNSTRFLTPLTPAKVNPVQIASREVHTEGAEIGSQRARRKPEIIFVFSVADVLPSVNFV